MLLRVLTSTRRRAARHCSNSWGTYWGEGGFARVAFGSVLIESMCSWATPKVNW